MQYELVYILSPKLSEEDAKKEMETIKEKMEAKGAKVTREDFWGRRKLAYEIKHLSHGYYILNVFESDTEVSNVIEKMLNIEKNVIRSMIVQYEGNPEPKLPEDKKPLLEKAEEEKEEVKEEKTEKKSEEPKEKIEKEEEKEVKPEEIDKKLDEILDKM